MYNNTNTWRISLTEDERKINVARFYKAMEYVNNLTQTDQQHNLENLEKAKICEIEYFEQATSKTYYYQLIADRLNIFKTQVSLHLQQRQQQQHEENEKQWYERRTEGEINENFKYHGNVKVIDNKYLDVFFEVPEEYWLDFINKHNHTKIINEEFHGHILEKEYTYMIYHSYYIVKRYIQNNDNTNEDSQNNDSNLPDKIQLNLQRRNTVEIDDDDDIEYRNIFVKFGKKKTSSI
jgi:hypothetical protein